MRFASLWVLWGAGLALLFGLILIIGAVRARLAKDRFGEDKRIGALMTYDAATRRAFKGVFLVLATALAFVAAARPQYGKGKELVPATKVDFVLVVDFSKSMYARDIEPSRISRAKSEVGELIQALPGARFGAVAFAGDSIGLPLTSDGASVAQFFRELEPNDMPVGGTAIARALRQAQEVFERDPKSKNHKRFVILITDGEDLEGSPKGVAGSMGDDGTTIHVVQIGTTTPERIPEMGTDGEVLGWRKTDDGEFMTTQLTSRGEQQLKGIASATPGGQIIVAQDGRTGIEQLTKDLAASLTTGEYVDQSSDVYADVYEYPLGAAILLLLLEAMLTDSPRRRFTRKVPPVAALRRIPVGKAVPRA